MKSRLFKFAGAAAMAVATLAVAIPVEAAASAPTPPRNIRGTGGLHSVTVTWSAPSSTGGSAITGYTAMITDVFNNQQQCPVNASTFTCTFSSGLVDFRRYYLTVKATNAIGTSVNSPTGSAMPYGAPAQPAIKYGYFDESTGTLTIRFFSRTPYPGAVYTVVANGSTVLCTTTAFTCQQTGITLHNARDMSGANFAETLQIYQSIEGVSGPSFSGTQFLYKTGCTTGCDIGVVGSYLMIRNGSLAGASLTNMNLYSSYFKDVNMTGANVSNSSFSGTTIWNVDFDNVTAANTRFGATYWYNSSVDGAAFSNNFWTNVSSLQVTGTPASLPGRVVKGHIVVPKAYLGGADLSSGDLSNLDLSGIAFTWTNLIGANLNGSKAVAFFLNSNVTNATFTGTTFVDATTRTAVGSAGVIGTPATLPDKWTVTGGVLVGPGAYLANREGIANLDLSNRDLSGIQLHTNSISNVNFSGSNLSGASFKNVAFSNVNLDGANLTKANLLGASGSVTGTPSAMPWGYEVLAGVIGPKP